MLEEGKEALQRTLLMMNYDMKKTLTENVEVLSEDAKEDQEIVNLFYNGAHSSPGTKESKLIDGFSKIKDANQFQRVEKLYATLGYETTLQDMLKSELGEGDANTFKKIQSSLSKAGVTLSGIVDITDSVDNDTIKITVNTSSPTPSVTATDTTKNDIAKKKFPCIGYESKDGDTVGHYAPAKMDFVRLFFKDYIYVYWGWGCYSRGCYSRCCGCSCFHFFFGVFCISFCVLIGFLDLVWFIWFWFIWF